MDEVLKERQSFPDLSVMTPLEKVAALVACCGEKVKEKEQGVGYVEDGVWITDAECAHAWSTWKGAKAPSSIR
jgi:hypothetical protein